MKIHGNLLIKNTGLNVVGQGIPLIVAVAAIPFITRGLGADRYGILSIAWVVIGYFAIVDLGLGRATTKFVAEALGKDKSEQVPAILWTSLAVQLFLGAMGSIILIIVSPVLVEQILNIPSDFIEEAKNVFYLLSVSIPVVICSGSLSGALEAAQRFDLLNAVRMPSSCLNYLLPLIGLSLNLGLPGIIVLLLILRIGMMSVLLILCFYVYPKIRTSFSIDTKMLRSLLTFGGWITICTILIPILVYLDRFLIGALSSVAAVGYYSVSFDAISRVGIVPASIAPIMFPAFSALEADKDKVEHLYVCSLKYLLLVIGPIILTLVIFAGNVLSLWLGSDWASKTTLVFQILAIGVLMNALAQMPANLLDGIGRPDLKAKVFLSYLLPYIILLWFLISRFGITGAALAWTLRATLELVLFFGMASRTMHFNPLTFVRNRLPQAIIVYGAITIIGLSMVGVWGKTVLIQGVIVITCLTIFALVAWRYILDDKEKQFLVLTIKKLW
jgi:O-antigen/teichoic acid export membrane protein